MQPLPTEFPSEGKRYYSYLKYAANIITAYSGNEPLHSYLKKYFAANSKHGSRDRKFISKLCYQYFRLGHGVIADMSLDNKIVLAHFVCTEAPDLFLKNLAPHWYHKQHVALSQKLTLIAEQFNADKIISFQGLLSAWVNKELYSLSFLKQPLLFIRTRPGNDDKVIEKIKSARFLYETPGAGCLSFANSQKLTEILEIDNEAVIQDMSSQQTGGFIQFCGNNILNESEDLSLPPGKKIMVWDCCAGSGGKSILAFDILKNIELTVTDKRESILHNLKARFDKAGIKDYHCSVANIAKTNPFDINVFDVIIADVPCTGSGTWSRTPERQFFFHKDEINQYVHLQEMIVSNAATSLKEGSYFIYITCSVFEKENEEMVKFTVENTNLTLLQSEYILGYEQQADSLFVAVFKN